MEGSLPLGKFNVFHILFHCSIPSTVIVLLWDSSETKPSLIPAYLLGTQQMVNYRVLLHNQVLDCASCPCFLTPAWALHTQSQSFVNETNIFPRQYSNRASWEASVNICWLRPAHLLAPSSLICLALAGMPPQLCLQAQPGPSSRLYPDPR